MTIAPWLKPPAFPADERKTRRARVLYATLLSFVGYYIFIEFSILVGGHIPSANHWISHALLGVCLLSYAGLQKGFVRSVSVVLLAVTFFLVTASIVNLGTVRAPISSVYYALIVVGGLLFDLPGVIVTIVLSSTLVGGLIVAQNQGLLPTPDSSVTFVQWVTFFALFVTNGGLVTVVLRWTRDALHRAEVEIAERAKIERELRSNKEMLERTNAELQTALAEVKTLQGLIPICANCKKIRDDKGMWTQIEAYLARHSDVQFTHGLCPDCLAQYFPAHVR